MTYRVLQSGHFQNYQLGLCTKRIGAKWDLKFFENISLQNQSIKNEKPPLRRETKLWLSSHRSGGVRGVLEERLRDARLKVGARSHSGS